MNSLLFELKLILNYQTKCVIWIFILSKNLKQTNHLNDF